MYVIDNFGFVLHTKEEEETLDEVADQMEVKKKHRRHLPNVDDARVQVAVYCSLYGGRSEYFPCVETEILTNVRLRSLAFVCCEQTFRDHVIVRRPLNLIWRLL